MQRSYLYYKTHEKMHEVVSDLNNERLNHAWRRLIDCVEPLYGPELDELYSKSLDLGWMGRKNKESDPCWEVPNDIYDYLMKCEETLREVRLFLAMQGVAPSPRRIKKMFEKQRRKKA